MLRRFLLLTIILPTLTTTASSISACSWDLEPTVLVLTSYEHAQHQNNNDQLVFKKLQFQKQKLLKMTRKNFLQNDQK